MATREKRGPLLVLAHTPPPFHGQSRMVALMLETFAQAMTHRKTPPSYFHIDCRYSDSLTSMGRPGLHKAMLALRYAFEALAVRFRHGTTSLYYVPAPGKHAAFLRDCLILLLLRPFFQHVIFQWHAAGLKNWLEKEASPIERWIGRRLYAHHDLSIVQLEEKAAEAAWFHPRKILVIPYGIPDPCPNFSPRAPRSGRPPAQPTRLLFLSIATKAKGVFTATTIWQQLNERALRHGSSLYHLTIAGEFPDPKEEQEFQQYLQRARISLDKYGPEVKEKGGAVEIIGQVQGEEKSAAYAAADVFLFPSTYAWESFGLVLVEAAHFGLPCVTYQPLVGPDGLSPIYHRRVSSGDTEAFVSAVENLSLDQGREIRQDALEKFNLALFGERMRAACLESDE